ncbi:hypothetical protein CLOBOL_00294 [Enterocloster bolteae ATCC BAA-613]|uniref:Uncharacterized protein n=1 Tax=Enterocloster bolteae (strain ATCC BAA-613 / DSM 15670 / CCUG 46953 / JCM 12243 / WAL 16351) TaxID=411902 RepID=A8RH25_ENTBW|nr:hypothetical protein CLOBOL_00294 [Enterocloster bolteae ATCC BAA-613]
MNIHSRHLHVPGRFMPRSGASFFLHRNFVCLTAM